MNSEKPITRNSSVDDFTACNPKKNHLENVTEIVCSKFSGFRVLVGTLGIP
jgi:hypothetical protein